MMNYKVYSVESRKGGVGKTTIALNLAKALIEEGADVLLIDCDITGTPITDAARHSPFWNNVVEVVCANGKPCNLIQYFGSIYLKGGYIEKDLINNIKFEPDKIHLIGSEIYDKNGKLIIDPRLLMDDLHSYWFVDMIKEIAEHYKEKSPASEVAVILDNSPGYVGIGKSIREWLTSVGYDHAQFLLVSSLDEQDVDSTVSSAMDIAKEMGDKWDVAHYYNLVSNHEGDFTELEKLLEENTNLIDFYYSLKEQPYETNLEAKPKAKDFISVVLNKVPTIYRDEHLKYIFKWGVSQERDQIINDIFPMSPNGLPQNMIEYDASISGQFIESNISTPESDESSKKKLNGYFNSFNQKRELYVESEDKANKAASLANSFGTLNIQLKKMGYQSLVDSLGMDLSTDFFVKDIVSFIRTLGNVAVPQVEQMKLNRKDIFNEDKNLLGKMISDNNLIDYSSVLYSLFNTIYKKVGFNNGFVYNKYLVVNLSLLFKKFVEVQGEQCKGCVDKKDYHMVLMKGHNDKTISQEVLDKLKQQEIDLDKMTKIMIEGPIIDMFRRYFVSFYQKMCYTLLRLIDCADDFGIVAHAYHTTIIRKGRSLDADLRQYLQAVVSRKTVEFNNKWLNELIDKPFEMQIVKDAIKESVLKKRQ